MPLQNRVTPFSRIESNPSRGGFMGNRGCLHNAHRQLRREFASDKRWICCLLEYKGRRRALMSPGRYTELFFIDEATALAAGHRPCRECRRPRFEEFVAAWRSAFGIDATAVAIDHRLHAERTMAFVQGTRSTAAAGALPAGTLVQRTDLAAWLIHDGFFLKWSHAGYCAREAIEPSESVTLLTIPSLVEVIRHGYHPQVHPSASCA